MLNYLDRLSTPEWLILIIIGLAAIAEVINLISKLWGFIAPKLFKISTAASRKKEIEEIILSNQKELKLLTEKHDKDMIELEIADDGLKDEIDKTNKKLDKISDLVLNMRIENIRDKILNFAATCKIRVYTREKYLDILETAEEYHKLIHEHNMVNGKFEISLEIIKERFMELEKNGGFLEDQIKKLD